MTRDDWLFVGVKLVGVYFAVLGVTLTVVVTAGQVLELVGVPDTPPMHRASYLAGFGRALAYLIAAHLLIRRTEWCLSWIHPRPRAGGADGTTMPGGER